MQAYHGRTFVGNHCHKYLQPSVTHDVCQSVVAKTFQLSDDVEVQKKAHDIASKYQILNELFTRVHKSTAHALQLQKKKSITLTVTSSNTWISTDLTLRSRKSFQGNTFWSATAHILCVSGSLDLVSWGSREEKRRMLLSTNSKLGWEESLTQSRRSCLDEGTIDHCFSTCESCHAHRQKTEGATLS